MIRFFLSCLIAFTAGHMTNYSVILYSQDLLHSPLISGIGFGLCFGPPLILGWVAGVECDRKPPSRIIHFATLVFILSGLVFFTGNAIFGVSPSVGSPLHVAFVLFSALIAGVGWSFVSPARMAALPQMVSAEALKTASLVFNIFVMLGFGLGPICISVCRSHFGWSGVFLTYMTLFALSSILLIGLQMRATSPDPSSGFHPSRILGSVRAGLRSARENLLIRDLLLSAVFGFMLMGPIQVIMPKFAVQVLGLSDIERGSFLGVLAPSFILGGILCMLLIRKIPNGILVFSAIFSAGISFFFFSKVSDRNTALGLLITVGTLGGLAMSTISAVLQGKVDPSVRGRIFSMYTITSQVMPAVSGILAGLFVHWVGPEKAAAICGALLALAAMGCFTFMRTLRKFSR